MELMYQSTRSEGTKVTASQAILKGLADDGGLFVPVSIPKLDISLEEISKMTYLSITAKPIYNRRPSGFLQQKKSVGL